MFETINPSQVSDCLSSVPHPLPSPDGPGHSKMCNNHMAINEEPIHKNCKKKKKTARKEERNVSKELVKNRYHQRNYPKTAAIRLTKQNC